MSKQNAILGVTECEDIDIFDFDELENKLQSDLELQLSELEFLKNEKEKIGSPENLGNTVINVVWEQFINQLAVTAGEDFIKENAGLSLDLRNEAHIQTTENFKNGKIATHNTKIDYQQRYNDWNSNFAKDENGNIVTHNTRSGKKEATLVKGARKPFDKGRPTGSAEKNTDMDHNIPAAEIIRDPVANAHMSKDQQIAFANSETNLNEMDSSLNRSKGDKSMTDWLDNPNSKGQKPKDIFNISDEYDKELRQKDTEAREEYEKQKKEGEQKSIVSGKQSQKEEALRITGKAFRTMVMQLLAELLKEIFKKLVSWFKSKTKNLKSLIDYIKSAINSFISKLKTHVINAGNSVISTITTSIFGPVVVTIKKVWIMLKQGWKSLKEAIDFLKRPDNKNKPIDILMLEVGKIVIAGLSAISVTALGEVIEKGLMTIPLLAIQIPIIGSLSSLIGLFMGGLIAGIIGAIAINLIDNLVAKQQKIGIVKREINKRNEVLSTQDILIDLNEKKLEYTKNDIYTTINNRHKTAEKIVQEALDNILDENTKNEIISSDNEEKFKEIDDLLKGLQD